MASEKPLNYVALSVHDRLNVAREALRVREMEHFRAYVGTPTAAPLTPEARSHQVDEIKKLQDLVKGLESEAEEAGPDPRFGVVPAPPGP